MGLRFSGVTGGVRAIYETQGRASRLPITLECLLPGRGYLKNGWKYWDMPVGGYAQGPGGVLVPKRLVSVQAAPATGLTIQTGTSTVNTGVAGAGWASNTVLVGKALDAHWPGKRVSLQRTNTVLQNRDPTAGVWTAGTGVTTKDQIGADALANGAWRGNCALAQYSNYQSRVGVMVVGTTYTYSLFLRAHAVGVNDGYDSHAAFGTTEPILTGLAAGVAYTRRDGSGICVANTNQTAMLVDGRAYGALAAARDNDGDFVQIENGQHPDEAIIVLAASVTRNGSGDYLAEIADLLTAGRLATETLIRPAGASTEYITDSPYNYVDYRDDGNYARIVNATHRVEVTVNGSTWSPAEVLTWARYDELRFFIERGGGVLRSTCKILYNESTVPVLHDLGDSGGPQGWIAAGAPLYILNREGTGQFSGWLGEFLGWEPLL